MLKIGDIYLNLNRAEEIRIIETKTKYTIQIYFHSRMRKYEFRKSDDNMIDIQNLKENLRVIAEMKSPEKDASVKGAKPKHEPSEDLFDPKTNQFNYMGGKLKIRTSPQLMNDLIMNLNVLLEKGLITIKGIDDRLEMYNVDHKTLHYISTEHAEALIVYLKKMEDKK